MKFGQKEIPEAFFTETRKKMLSNKEFTPNGIRLFILEKFKADLSKIDNISHNHKIIADRVMRKCLNGLVEEKHIYQVKRGLWVHKPTHAA
jgi:hypothetical protein